MQIQPLFFDKINTMTKVNQCNVKVNISTEKEGKKCAPLDTLAQLGTEHKKNTQKARRKYFSNGLSVGLVSASERNEDSVLKKSYWRTYHCNSQINLHEVDGKKVLKSKYCNARWCMTCNAIRTAKHIIAYAPIINEWDDACFLTLTQKTVSKENLPLQLAEMYRIFSSIKHSAKMKHQRGQLSFKLEGIRKLECTFNQKTDLYHPHFHIVLKSMEMGKFIKDEWLKRNCNAGIKGQDCKKADKYTLVELFKYMTKVIASTGKRPKTPNERVINADSLDVIFNALIGIRTVQSFGFLKPSINEDCNAENPKVKGIADAVLQWNNAATDWVDTDTGELFTGYKPSESFKKLIDNI